MTLDQRSTRLPFAAAAVACALSLLSPQAGAHALPHHDPSPVHSQHGGQSHGTHWVREHHAAPAVAGYRIAVAHHVTAGDPFAAEIYASAAKGHSVTDVTYAVYLSSTTNNLLFTNAQCVTGATTATAGPTACWVVLRDGRARVRLLDNVPETTTLQVQDQAGRTGAQAVVVGAPRKLGVTLQTFAGAGTCGSAPSGSAVSTQAVAAINFMDTDNGLLTASVDGGFWPLGPGLPYQAQYSGTLYVSHAGNYQFADSVGTCGSATVTPIAGTGASVNGTGAAIIINGNAPAVTAALTQGQYQVVAVQQTNTVTGGAGDALLYGFGASATLQPIPPRAFTPAGLPAPHADRGDR